MDISLLTDSEKNTYKYEMFSMWIILSNQRKMEVIIILNGLINLFHLSYIKGY